ncbi:MAG: hypothetical protein PUK59_02845 [Actinomycetaceae bacterium]|nr:hypothetical protein [Actinomycetaceae bacterium]MDY5855361.1 hypothetical protein [Arcanobacterium sp.]
MTSRKRYVILTPFAQTEVVAAVAALHEIEADVVATSSGAALVRDVPVPTFDDWDISELLGSDESDTGNVAASNADVPPMAADSDMPPIATEPLADSASSAALPYGSLREDGDSSGVNSSDASSSGADSAASESVDSDDPFAVAATFSRLSPYGVVLFQAELGEDVGGEDGVSGLVSAQRVLGGKAGEELHAGLLLNSLDPKLEDLVLGLRSMDDIDPQVIHPQTARGLVHTMFASGSASASEPSADSATTGTAEAEVAENHSAGGATPRGEPADGEDVQAGGPASDGKALQALASSDATSSDDTGGEAAQGDTVQGEASGRSISGGEVLEGETDGSGVTSGKAAQDKAAQGEASHGEAGDVQ